MAEAIVLGAGAAGLGAAATLAGADIETVVLERADRVGASWRTRYDGLRLNTTGWMSAQPGFRAGRRRYGEFPSRDEWVGYLEDYAAHHRIDIRFGTHAHRVSSADGGWCVETDSGTLSARFVVIATGFEHDPDLPDWPGRDGFTGELIHSSAYRSPEPYRGRDVLVVGPGTTGTEVASYLAKGGAGRVRVACRTPRTWSRARSWGPRSTSPESLSTACPWASGTSSRGPHNGGSSAASTATGFHARRSGSPQRCATTSERRPTPKGSCPC